MYQVWARVRWRAVTDGLPLGEVLNELERVMAHDPATRQVRGVHLADNIFKLASAPREPRETPRSTRSPARPPYGAVAYALINPRQQLRSKTSPRANLSTVAASLLMQPGSPGKHTSLNRLDTPRCNCLRSQTNFSTLTLLC